MSEADAIGRCGSYIGRCGSYGLDCTGVVGCNKCMASGDLPTAIWHSKTRISSEETTQIIVFSLLCRGRAGRSNVPQLRAVLPVSP